MRGHRSSLAALALALLLGTAGAPSNARVAFDAGLRAWGSGAGHATRADALTSPLWEQALASQRGDTGRSVEERTGTGDGSADRHGLPRRATYASTPVPPASAPRPTTPRPHGLGARLLGLPAAPANAPPIS